MKIILYCVLLFTELAQELKTGKLISKFEDFDYYSDSDDESPYVYTCSFVLAIMYFERLKASNPNFFKSINSSELFLISLVRIKKHNNVVFTQNLTAFYFS